MMLFFQMCIIQMILVGLVSLLSLFSSWKEMKESLKLSPFECGFTPSQKSRNNFSLPFFLVTLVFMVFDVELALFFPLLTTMSLPPTFPELLTFIMIITILTLGLLWEWAQGMLEWFTS